MSRVLNLNPFGRPGQYDPHQRRLFLRRVRRPFHGKLAAIFLMVVVFAFSAVPEAFCKRLRAKDQTTVMTQNLYVGADILLVAQATSLDQIPFLVATTFNNIILSDFQGRAERIAARIAAEDPDLVALQEVSLLRRQSPGDFMQGNPNPAEAVVTDYLAILLEELNALGLSYRVAAVVENANIEMPMFAGFEGGIPKLDDVRLTDRDVILARSNVETWNAESHSFLTNYVAFVGSMPIVFKRGFLVVTAKVHGEIFRFANAHLEVRENTVQVDGDTVAVQLLQAEELTNALKDERLPVILVGDFNSSSMDPCGFAYSYIRDEGYADMWNHRVTGNCEQGYTCCQDENLSNPESALSERIDHIFFRNRSGCVGPVAARRVGHEPEDRTGSGLWPSDHAGVVAFFPRSPCLK